MRSIFLFLIAGVCEIGGGYLVWLWLREGRGLLFGIIGFTLLASYGIIPVLQPKLHPFGRIYAAYGAVFIILSMFWGWAVDRRTPDFLDLVGVSVCVMGAALIMWPRAG